MNDLFAGDVVVSVWLSIIAVILGVVLIAEYCLHLWRNRKK